MSADLKIGGVPIRAIAGAGLLALAAQGGVWFVGIGWRHAHWALAPFWIAAFLLLWRARRGLGFSFSAVRWTPDPGRATIALILIFGLAWTAALAQMYLSFRFAAFDLGIYSSIAFNTAYGQPFFSSVQQINHLGEHFSPIVAAFAPLYRIAPSPVWLLAAGLAAYLSTPVLLLCLVRRHGLERCFGPWIGFCLALLWFLNQPMTSAIKFLFHPSTLAAPFVLLAWDAAAGRRWRRLALWLAFLLLFKESLALAAAGIGLWLLARRGTRRAGAILLGVGLAAGALLAGWFIPMMRGGEWTHVERIAPLDDLPAKAGYVVRLLLPFGFLHLRGRALLPALPLILLNVATGYGPQYGMAHHYDDVIVPLLFVGAVGTLADGGRPLYGRWPVPVAVVAAALCVLIPLGLSPPRLIATHWPRAEHAAVREGMRALAGDPGLRDSMVYVQSHLDPFLQRTKKAAFDRLDPHNPPAGAFVVLSPHVAPWPDASFEEALSRIVRSQHFDEIPGVPGLRVFRARGGATSPRAEGRKQ